MFSAKSGDFAERTTKSENRQSNNEKRTTNNEKRKSSIVNRQSSIEKPLLITLITTAY
jgi:hypothetical protein